MAAAGRAAGAAASGAGQALAGACRSWQAADAAGRTPTQAVADRLTTAAGGADAIAAYCAALVGEDNGNVADHPSAAPHPTPAPTPNGSKPTEPPAKGHASGTPAHPAPPTHRD
jgi:hypothetical protein